MNDPICSDGCRPAPELGAGWILFDRGRGCPRGCALYGSAHSAGPNDPVTMQHGPNREHRRTFTAQTAAEFDHLQMEWFDEIHSD